MNYLHIAGITNISVISFTTENNISEILSTTENHTVSGFTTENNHISEPFSLYITVESQSPVVKTRSLSPAPVVMNWGFLENWKSTASKHSA